MTLGGAILTFVVPLLIGLFAFADLLGYLSERPVQRTSLTTTRASDGLTATPGGRSE